MQTRAQVEAERAKLGEDTAALQKEAAAARERLRAVEAEIAEAQVRLGGIRQLLSFSAHFVACPSLLQPPASSCVVLRACGNFCRRTHAHVLAAPAGGQVVGGARAQGADQGA